MPVTVVVGAQFGDEAKGKITDYLASDARYVVRTGGGPNAGHSIHLREGVVVLHQLACGVLRPGVTGISGPGMVLQPMKLEEELRALQERGLFRGRLLLSDRAHVLLPLHEIEDGWEDDLREQHSSSGGLGTTRRGIGPAYADRYGRWGIRLGDLDRPATLRQRLELLYVRKAHLPDLPPREKLASDLAEVGGRLAPYIQPTEPILWEAIGRGDRILLEGAQSSLLDIDFGTYPYVTSSHPTSAGALVGSGIPPQAIDRVVGVAKAYSTRVGAGPFPTLVEGEIGEYLQRVGGERGATTGRPRQCGWLDLVLLRYAARLNGFTSFAITKVDVLGGLEEVRVCVRYELPDGTSLTDRPPTSAEDLARVRPVYERLPCWGEFHPRLRERLQEDGAAAFPAELRAFLSFVTQETGVPVEFVSFGPARETTLRLGHGPSATPASPSVRGWKG